MSIKQKQWYVNKERRIQRAIWNGAKVFLVFKDGKLVGEWLVQKFCCEELKLSRAHVNSCLKGSRNSHKGFTFKYKEVI